MTSTGYYEGQSNLGQPRFVIFGVGRCGTTTLYENIVRHPEISRSRVKEISFFRSQFSRGRQWYEKQIGVGISGEASPQYFTGSKVPGRIKKMYPDVRLIVLMRNPVDGVECSLTMRQRHNFLYSKPQIDISKVALEKLSRTQVGSTDPVLDRYCYEKHMKRWLRAFDQEQILFLQSEHLFENLQEELATVFRHIGVDPVSIETVRARSLLDMDTLSEDVRNRLGEFYAPYNERFYEMGIDWRWE